ncbi:transposase [Streptomyces sp. NPDC005373]|uniref:transposase n=1 Tax=unclassified Streptomyces TaxID=2593676 RepID=UPI0033B4AE65
MTQKRRKFSPEFRDEAVKMVVVESRPIAEVAREIQVNEGTLGTWVSRYRQEHAGEEPPLNISERARLRELERENRELRMKTEFLGKAALGSTGRCNIAGRTGAGGVAGWRGSVVRGCRTRRSGTSGCGGRRDGRSARSAVRWARSPAPSTVW